MDNLIKVEFLVEPALKALTSGNMEALQSVLIALRRIRNKWRNSLDDFVTFLNKNIHQDSDFLSYFSFFRFISQKFNGQPFATIMKFLEEKGYCKDTLSFVFIHRDYDEGAFLNRLPNNNQYFFLLACIYYIFNPQLTIKYFMEQLIYPFCDEEKKLLENYRRLPQKKQTQILEIMQNL